MVELSTIVLTKKVIFILFSFPGNIQVCYPLFLWYFYVYFIVCFLIIVIYN